MLYFPNYCFFADGRLMKHTLKTVYVNDLDNCELLCCKHDNCVSLNVKKDSESATGQLECEINNSTHMEHDEDLAVNNAFLYRGGKAILFCRHLFQPILTCSQNMLLTCINIVA